MTTAYRETHIMMRDHNIRAIDAGLKTQTRRVVVYPGKALGSGGKACGEMLVDWSRAWVDPGGTALFGPGPYLKVPTAHPHDGWAKKPEDDAVHRIHCPYGYPGDRLWVKSSLFMPKRSARHWLEITEIRLQRLHQISLKDVLAEGIEQAQIDKYKPYFHPDDCHGLAFGESWNRINAKRGHPWMSNPWVWAITFRRLSGAERN